MEYRDDDQFWADIADDEMIDENGHFISSGLCPECGCEMMEEERNNLGGCPELVNVCMCCDYESSPYYDC